MGKIEASPNWKGEDLMEELLNPRSTGGVMRQPERTISSSTETKDPRRVRRKMRVHTDSLQRSYAGNSQRSMPTM